MYSKLIGLFTKLSLKLKGYLLPILAKSKEIFGSQTNIYIFLIKVNKHDRFRVKIFEKCKSFS